MNDLTIIMLTPNKVPAVWAAHHRKVLEQEAIGAAFITISAQPLDWGLNLIQEGYGMTNIYRQLLRGAQMATTPYIAVADDDTLYPREHFLFRPPMDKFAYNYNRWHILTWMKRRPFYFHKPRPGNGLLIAARELVVNAISRRLEGRDELSGSMLRELGSGFLKKYDQEGMIPFYTYEPVVSFYHDFSIDLLNQNHKKKPWPVQAYDLPKWGRAEDVLKLFI